PRTAHQVLIDHVEVLAEQQPRPPHDRDSPDPLPAAQPNSRLPPGLPTGEANEIGRGFHAVPARREYVLRDDTPVIRGDLESHVEISPARDNARVSNARHPFVHADRSELNAPLGPLAFLRE